MNEKIKYMAHVAGDGWQTEVEDGAIAGTVGRSQALECFRITGGLPEGVGVHAFAHVQDLGWSAGNIQGEDVGSTGLGKHIEAVKMGLFGENADKYTIWYRLHVADRGFLDWCRDGELNGTVGGNVQAEAIQIILRRKDENFWPASNQLYAFEDLTEYMRSLREAAAAANRESEDSKRARVIARAQSELGYTSGTSEDSKYGRKYSGAYAGSWCAFFVMSCFDDEGLKDAIPFSSYCPTIVDTAKKWGTWHAAGTYTPKTGDLVLYDFNYNNVSDHVGIVESVPYNGAVYAIEGNTGSPVGVYRKLRTSGILGYVTPRF